MLAVALGGCVAEVSDMPAGLVDETIASWQERGLPMAQECYDEREAIVLVVTADGCPTADAESCFQYDGSVPTIWVKHRLESGRSVHYTLHHELQHWLSMCSGYAPDGDPTHSRPLVWGTVGK